MIEEIEISLDSLVKCYSTKNPDLIIVDTRFFTIRLRNRDYKDNDPLFINTDPNLDTKIIPVGSIIKVNEIIKLLSKLKNFFMKDRTIAAVVIKNSGYNDISTTSESPTWIKYLRFKKIFNSEDLYVAYSYIGGNITFLDWRNCFIEDNYFYLCEY